MTQEQNGTTRDWSAIGLAWETDSVRERFGPNESDIRITNAKAQLPKIVDLEKFREHFGDDCFVGWLNSSNSLRVRAQAIGRTFKGSIEQNRELVYNAIRGVRSTTRSSFDRDTFIRTYVAKLVDAGTTAENAILLANLAADSI